MAERKHSTVARNKGYGSTEFKTRQRHNERQNESYYNGDIMPERSHLNVQYQRYVFPDGTPETYEQSFNRMLAVGTITKRGLKDDAKVFAELVFDVNTEYFDERGGYEFAKKFYDEAYRLAVKEVGDERLILSAVMHADERHSALSEELGRDVFHYHLHVVYIPVVEKEIYYRKDCKDPEKAGKLKEVIPQISHSKKWPIRVPVEHDGKTYNVNSYSFLQDRYYEHMIAAGFEGFERGEFGSKRKHLDVETYKRQQEQLKYEKAAAQVESAKKQLAELKKEIVVKEKAKATIAEVEAMGKPAILGGFNVTGDELKKLKALAKKSINADKQIADSKKKMAELDEEISKLNNDLRNAKAEINHWHQQYTGLWNEVKDFIGAVRKFPARLREFVGVLFRPEREAARQQELEFEQQQQSQPAQKKKSYDYGR